MGLLNCFGLRTKSYNAKKYELNADKKDKNKKRVSTDSFGVADTNVHPQLIEETGGEIHSITSDILKDRKDSNENVCQSIDNHKNETNANDNEKIGQQTDVKEDNTDDKCHQNEEQNKEMTHESEHHISISHTVIETNHQIHSTTDHSSFDCDSGNQSHSTDQNTVSMDTSCMSGGGMDSSSGVADSSSFD